MVFTFRLDMQIKYLNSATVLISKDDTSILCDPWLIDGEFYGSWCIYPPLKVKPQDFDDVNAIYISHIHPDHFSVKTLQKMNRKIQCIFINLLMINYVKVLKIWDFK